ncbi:MAG: 5-(carboxyamino)imidazole ribonucleotide synthase [Gammaproteobacteria bacterium]|nr:5-(carboxyamino)imidazole ribonucleotide synthase [Gammaproteobacteria bacterium]
MSMPVLPPATLGMLGGGQLGRMFVIAARTMGYEVIVLDPDANSPAGGMATEHLVAGYDDHEALDYLKQNCQVVSTEFENIPAETLENLAQSVAVHPSANALRIAQNRQLEKHFITENGLNTAAYVAIEDDGDIEHARNLPFPAIMKTATLGYDGKGQIVCDNFEDLPAAFEQLNRQPCVVEKKVDLAKEVSVVLCRSQSGDIDCFPVAENLHVKGILDISIVPTDLSVAKQDEVKLAASKIASGLDYCGVLAVEFFITTDGAVLVNEIAPRPHNSGHYTLDACYSSQFEQQVRMICGLPAGNSKLHTPVAMWNILGDIWPHDGEPEWQQLADLKSAKLHLYGKKQARVGRKMGHVNCLGKNNLAAMDLLQRVKQALQS